MRAKVLHVSAKSSFLEHYANDSLFRAQVSDLIQLDQAAELGLCALNSLIDSHPEVRHSVPISRISKEQVKSLVKEQSSSKECLRREVMTRLTALIVNKLNIQLMRHVAGGRSFRGIGLLLCEDTRFNDSTGSYDELCFSFILDSLDAESVGVRTPLIQYEDKKTGAFRRELDQSIELRHANRVRKYNLPSDDEDSRTLLRGVWKRTDNEFLRKLLKVGKSRYSAFLSPTSPRCDIIRSHQLLNLMQQLRKSVAKTRLRNVFMVKEAESDWPQRSGIIERAAYLREKEMLLTKPFKQIKLLRKLEEKVGAKFGLEEEEAKQLLRLQFRRAERVIARHVKKRLLDTESRWSVASEISRRSKGMNEAEIFNLKKKVLDLQSEKDRLQIELQHKSALLEEEALRATLLEEELSLTQISANKREQNLASELQEVKSKNGELIKQQMKVNQFLKFLEREMHDSSSLDTTVLMPLLNEPMDSFQETRILPSATSLSGRLKRLKEDVIAHNEEASLRQHQLLQHELNVIKLRQALTNNPELKRFLRFNGIQL